MNKNCPYVNFLSKVQMVKTNEIEDLKRKLLEKEKEIYVSNSKLEGRDFLHMDNQWSCNMKEIHD